MDAYFSIQEVVRRFQNNYIADKNHRNASFDYCYYYFYTNRNDLCGKNLEKSCLALWSYLSSWGMLRGSGKLLQKSPFYLIPLIEYINNSKNARLWNIDVCDYGDERNVETLLNTYSDIKKILKDVNPSMTLITKIMLGVYANIPAFDRYFTDAFRTLCAESKCKFSVVNKKSIDAIRNFYLCHKEEIDSIKIDVLEFDSSDRRDSLCYSRAKIIDMYGFEYSLGIELANK